MASTQGKANVCDQVSKGKIFLVLAPPEARQSCPQQISEFTKKGIIIYVSASKPYAALEEELRKQKANLENVLFVDMTVKTTQSKQEKKVILIDSPHHLTDLSIALNEIIHSLPPKKKAIIVDSLNTLALYNDEPTVIRFTNFLVNKLRCWKVGGAFFAVKDANKALAMQAAQFCDAVIEA
ncbi:MAG: DUF7504 family protein [Candidatus Micrarchaeia archaeon]